MSALLTSRSDSARTRDAIQHIERLGGQVGYDDYDDEVVVRVAFSRENGIGNDDLALLAVFPELRHLVLLSDRVTDAGLAQLAGLHRLRWLAIYSRSVTVRGVLTLAEQLDALEGVSIRRTTIAEEDKAAFLEALPWVKWR